MSYNTTTDLWPDICEKLGKRVGTDIVDRWFSDGVITFLDDLELRIKFPTSLHVTWAETYYRPDLERVISDHLASKPKVTLEAPEELEELLPDEDGMAADMELPDEAPPAPLPGDPGLAAAELEAICKKPDKAPTAKVREAGLNPTFDFDSFVVGDNIAYGYAAARAVAEKPGGLYNPVLIHGNSGLGKTHLLSAIGLDILRRYPKKRVLSVTGEEFTNEFIDAIHHGKLTRFRAKFRKVDVLLVDDIQFVAGKEATQEEFFHTFNSLVNNRCQVVLVSDRAPADIPRLQKRLLTRFQWGITAEMMAPTVETRIAILRQKAHDWNVEMDSEVIEFLASRIKKNVRTLEGALLRVSSYLSLYRGAISMSQVEAHLQDLLSQESRGAMVTVNAIQKEVASYFDVRVADLCGRSRTQLIIQPRHVAMFLSRELTNASLKEIGQAFGGRDHGTVIHACRKVQHELEESPETKRIVNFLRDSITG